MLSAAKLAGGNFIVITFDDDLQTGTTFAGVGIDTEVDSGSMLVKAITKQSHNAIKVEYFVTPTNPATVQFTAQGSLSFASGHDINTGQVQPVTFP